VIHGTFLTYPGTFFQRQQAHRWISSVQMSSWTGVYALRWNMYLAFGQPNALQSGTAHKY